MECECGGIIFSSKLPSGNLKRVECLPDQATWDYNFRLWLSRDCEDTVFQTSNCTWFYFSVRGYSPGSSICLQIANMQNQTRLFRHGHVPLSRTLPNEWERIRSGVDFQQSDEGFALTFSFAFPPEEDTVTEFAFTYPWTFQEEQDLLAQLDRAYSPHLPANKDLYYHREILCYSVGGRPVDLITISAPNGMRRDRERKFDCRLFPKSRRCLSFNKKVVLLTARVHPGETPGSFVLMGILKFLLLRKEPRAIRLRREFVFKIVPMVNPDGVVAGNYRMDSLGVNLNRFYDLPDPVLHPSVYAVKSLAVFHHVANSGLPGGGGLLQRIFDNPGTGEHLNSPDLLAIPPAHSGVAFYIDFHGHVSKRGCFLFGNHMRQEKLQVDNVTLSMLLSLNCRHFDLDSCNFSERMMSCTDGRGQSREGSARVGIYRAIGIVHSYTFECNYNTNRIVNEIPPLAVDEPTTYTQKYTKLDFYQIGRDVAISLLDYCGRNPNSRLPASKYKNVAGIRQWATRFVHSQRKKSKSGKRPKDELAERADGGTRALSDAEVPKADNKKCSVRNVERKVLPKIPPKKCDKNPLQIPIATVWPFKKPISCRKRKHQGWLKGVDFKEISESRMIEEATKIKVSGVAFFVKI